MILDHCKQNQVVILITAMVPHLVLLLEQVSTDPDPQYVVVDLADVFFPFSVERH